MHRKFRKFTYRAVSSKRYPETFEGKRILYVNICQIRSRTISFARLDGFGCFGNVSLNSRERNPNPELPNPKLVCL